MAPLRNGRVNNRTNRSQIDHDIMEGLPIRQWRKISSLVSTAPPKEVKNVIENRDTIWKEYPLPRGSELYSSMSQSLLRAARAPQISRLPVAPLEEDKEAGDEDDVDADFDTGFINTRWIPLSREKELPEPEFLAKRRRGLPSIYGSGDIVVEAASQMRKTKIRKIDADGNATVLEILVPEGTAVEGEVVEGEEGMPDVAPPSSTVVDGVAIPNSNETVAAGHQQASTPVRRRYPPPKRKAKGASRSRKKRIVLAKGGTGAAIAINVDGTGTEAHTQDDSRTDGVADGDDSVMQDGEEESGSDEDDDAEEGDDVDREEGELSPSPDADAPNSLSDSPSKPSSNLISHAHPPVSNLGDSTSITGQSIDRDVSSSPELPLAAGQLIKTLPLTINPPPELPHIKILDPAPIPTDFQEPLVEPDQIESVPQPLISPVRSILTADSGALSGLVDPLTEALSEKPAVLSEAFDPAENLVEPQLTGQADVLQVVSRAENGSEHQDPVTLPPAGILETVQEQAEHIESAGLDEIPTLQPSVATSIPLESLEDGAVVPDINNDGEEPLLHRPEDNIETGVEVSSTLPI